MSPYHQKRTRQLFYFLHCIYILSKGKVVTWCLRLVITSHCHNTCLYNSDTYCLWLYINSTVQCVHETRNKISTLMRGCNISHETSPTSTEQTISLKYWHFLYHNVYIEPQRVGIRIIYAWIVTIKMGRLSLTSNIKLQPFLLIFLHLLSSRQYSQIHH